MRVESTPLLILGNGTFAVEVADLASDIPGFRLAGFVQNVQQDLEQELLPGIRTFWIEDAKDLAPTHRAICALGATHRRTFIEQAERLGFAFATLIHPTARVSSSTTVCEGCVVSAGVVIASHSRLGRHIIVNRGALLGHHLQLDDYVTIGPGVNIAASCRIGEGAFVGIGAIVRDHVEIGAHSVVGAGAVVTRHVPEHVMVFGNPARIIKRNIQGM